MPKAKPDQVIVHRVELQETERATLEAALAGRFVTNAVSAAGSVFAGIGSVLAPFTGVLTAIGAAYIAEKGISGMLEAAGDAGSNLKDKIEEQMAEQGAPIYAAMSAWIIATYENGGWDAICNSNFQHYREGAKIAEPYGGGTLRRNTTKFYNPYLGMDAPGWFILKCAEFLREICANRKEHERFGVSPIDLWSQHFSLEQYGSEAYYYASEGAKGSIFG